MKKFIIFLACIGGFASISSCTEEQVGNTVNDILGISGEVVVWTANYTDDIEVTIDEKVKTITKGHSSSPGCILPDGAAKFKLQTGKEDITAVNKSTGKTWTGSVEVEKDGCISVEIPQL